MPFTLSHPAAVLPLRRVMPFTALVIGSMAPDFPYFVGLGELRFRTHSFASVATFSVPVGLAAYFVFERWLRAAWCDLLPAALASRVTRAPRSASWARVVAALAVGALTHVVWDSFTHEHEPGVRLVNALNGVIVDLLGTPLRGYNVLQYGSTLVGGGLIAIVLWRWLARTPRGPLPESWARAARARRIAPWLACGVLAPAALAFAASEFPPRLDLLRLRMFAGAAVVSGMSLALAALFAYAAWWRRVAWDASPLERERASGR